MDEQPLLQAVDAVTVPVPDLDSGLAFYQGRLGHRLLWRNDEVGQAGLALSAPLRGGGDDEPSPVKLGVKLLIAILIFIMVFVPRKRAEVNRGHFIGIIALTLINAAVATFWR
jgi:catechol 2,3-dioxygenase-like lactoylglutathione lyase family enzyme